MTPQCVDCIIGNLTLGGSGGGPAEFAYDVDNGLAYIGMSNWYNVDVINLTTLNCVECSPSESVGGIPTGGGPYDLVWVPTTNQIWTGNSNTFNVTIINGSTDQTIGNLGAGCAPQNMLYDAHNNYVYLADLGINCPTWTNNVTIYNATTWNSVGSIPVGVAPYGIILDPRNGYLYVSNSGSFNVTVINSTTNQVIGAIPVGDNPDELLYDPLNNMIYVDNYISGNVSVINATTDQDVDSIPCGANPDGLVLDNRTGLLYVMDESTGAIIVIDPVSDTRVAQIDAASSPANGFYNWRTNTLYVAFLGVNEVQAIRPFYAIGTLEQAEILPAVAHIDVGGSYLFNSQMICEVVPCRDHVHYAWSLSNSIGSLNATNTAVVNFTAGAEPGQDTLFLNATMNGTTVASVPVTITVSLPPPQLISVAVTPNPATVPMGGDVTFDALPSCTEGPCPVPLAYKWTFSGGLGSPNSTQGPVVGFQAGAATGTETLTATVFMGSQIITSPAATLTITKVTLTGATLVPPTITLIFGEQQAFYPSPQCSGGPCLGWGYTNAWSVENPLGYLNSTAADEVTFTASTTVGTVLLFDNVTFQGVTVETAPARITIVEPVTILSTVTVSPSVGVVQIGTNLTLHASAACAPVACQGVPAFLWGLNNSLGTTTPSVGPTIKFQAGHQPGLVQVLLTGLLDGIEREANATVLVTISAVPTVASVTIAPSVAGLSTTSTLNFTAAATCSFGSCPAAGLVWVWSVNSTLGSLVSPPDQPTAEFVAGFAPGAVAVTVTATLNGVGASASSQVTINANPPTKTTGGILGLPGWEGYGVIAVLLAVVVLTVILVLNRAPRSDALGRPVVEDDDEEDTDEDRHARLVKFIEEPSPKSVTLDEDEGAGKDRPKDEELPEPSKEAPAPAEGTSTTSSSPDAGASDAKEEEPSPDGDEVPDPAPVDEDDGADPS